MNEIIISADEWKEKCSLIEPLRKPKFPNCEQLFQRYHTVAGQQLNCPPVWVCLVECIGTVLNVKSHSHPLWEQNQCIGPQSKYYPTMLLFVVHNYTALRRLEQVSLISDTDMAEVTRILSSPVLKYSNLPCDSSNEVLLSEAAVRELCGDEAGLLCNFIENIVFQCEEANNLIKMIRFKFTLRCEQSELLILRQAYDYLNKKSTITDGLHLQLLPLMNKQEAARYSLFDVHFTDVRDFVNIDINQDTSPRPANSMHEAHLIVIAIIKIVVLLVSGNEFCGDEESSNGGCHVDNDLNCVISKEKEIPPHYRIIPSRYHAVINSDQSNSEPGQSTFNYEEPKKSVKQTLKEILRKATCIENITPAEACDAVFTESGVIRDYVKEFIPTYENLNSVIEIVKNFISSSDSHIKSKLPEWRQRNWESVLCTDSIKGIAINENNSNLKELYKIIMWVTDTINTWPVILKLKQSLDDFDIANQKVVIQKQSFVKYRNIRFKAQCNVENQTGINNKKREAIQVTGTENSLQIIVRNKDGDDLVKINSPPAMSLSAAYQRQALIGKSHLRGRTDSDEFENAISWSASLTSSILTDDTILKLFNTLEVDDSDLTSFSEVKSIIESFNYLGPESSCITDKEWKRMVGKKDKIDIHDFKTLLLNLSKQ